MLRPATQSSLAGPSAGADTGTLNTNLLLGLTPCPTEGNTILSTYGVTDHILAYHWAFLLAISATCLLLVAPCALKMKMNSLPSTARLILRKPCASRTLPRPAGFRYGSRVICSLTIAGGNEFSFLAVRGWCYKGFGLACILAFALGSSYVWPWPSDAAPRTQVFQWTRSTAPEGSAPGRFAALPGSLNCSTVPAALAAEWYGRVATMLQARQLAARHALPRLHPPVLDAELTVRA